MTANRRGKGEHHPLKQRAGLDGRNSAGRGGGQDVEGRMIWQALKSSKYHSTGCFIRCYGAWESPRSNFMIITQPLRDLEN